MSAQLWQRQRQRDRREPGSRGGLELGADAMICDTPICIECGEGVDPRDEVLVGDSVIHRGECDAAWTWKFQVANTRADERLRIAAAMREGAERWDRRSVEFEGWRVLGAERAAELREWADKIERGEIK